MDFSKVTIIEKANPRKPEVIKKKKEKAFHLKVDYVKQTITFSHELFEQIQLKHNSLAQGIGPDGELLLLVMPGNSGVFAKSQAKGGKGNTFKNHKITDALVERGWTGGKFNLDFVGENEGILYYSIVPFVEEESKSDSSEGTEASEVSEEEVSFN